MMQKCCVYCQFFSSNIDTVVRSDWVQFKIHMLFPPKKIGSLILFLTSREQQRKQKCAVSLKAALSWN